MPKPSEVVEKHPGNPIITFRDVPWRCTGAYNPGCVKTPEGKYALVFRADEFTDVNSDQVEKLGVKAAAEKGGSIALALSDDGIAFEVQPEPVLRPLPDEECSIYDPRLTMIDGTYWMTYATSTTRGIMCGIARSRDLHNWERVHRTLPDNRNAVLFPEKIGGLYARLDRPFGHIFVRGRGFDMWLGYSPDMEFWGRHQMVLQAADVSWGKVKVGPGTPPVRTEAGWLTLFHGVEMREPDKFGWPFIYRAGVMLLDPEDPSRVVGMCSEPILEPTEDYENIGYCSRVVFPTAMVPEADGTVKIYYGAADQCVALATARLDDLIALCR